MIKMINLIAAKVIDSGIKLLFGTIFVCFTANGIRAQTVDPINPDYTSFPKKEWEKKFDAFTFRIYQADGHTLPYRFYQPQPVRGNKGFPLVIFLHGAGERGFDNRTQFMRFAPTVFWEKYPCFVLAPECPSKTSGTANAESVWVDTSFGAALHHMNMEPTWPLHLVLQLIDETIMKYPVDKNRIYVTGLSMGGYATREILQREGDRFAAAIPVCGGGDPDYASKIKSVKLWVFHGSDDRTVPDKFRLREMHSFQLSETPEIIGSVPDVNPRMVTWLRLAVINRPAEGEKSMHPQDYRGHWENTQEFYVFNTHYFNGPIDTLARINASKLILQKVNALSRFGSWKAERPVFLMGDFNCRPGSAPYKILVGEKNSGGSGLLINSFEDPKKIDWILYKGAVKVQKYEEADYNVNGVYPSDHKPVIVDFEL